MGVTRARFLSRAYSVDKNCLRVGIRIRRVGHDTVNQTEVIQQAPAFLGVEKQLPHFELGQCPGLFCACVLRSPQTLLYFPLRVGDGCSRAGSCTPGCSRSSRRDESRCGACTY